MKNLRNRFPFFIITLTFLTGIKSHAQDTQFKLIQDNKYEKLLKEKQNTNNSFAIYKNFSIQIFNGEKDETETLYNEFKRKYPNTEATIIYADPKYKLIIGNYRNKIDAERNLKKFKTNYENAFLVRLKK